MIQLFAHMCFVKFRCGSLLIHIPCDFKCDNFLLLLILIKLLLKISMAVEYRGMYRVIIEQTIKLTY